jgi:predicted lipoprotein with Yx(FWY)xxD motif
MLRLTSLALAAVVLAASTATGSVGAAARGGTTVRTVGSQFGTILGDRKGQAFYVFGNERTSRSECYGACAKAWPPVPASGRPVAAKGVRASLIGTTRRRDGSRQLTFRGRPLYFYVSDAPGRVLCHDVREFDGLWQVIRPDGVPVA